MNSLAEREGTRLDFKRDLSGMPRVEGRDLRLLRASYAAGPFFVKAKGKDKGTFVRIGSKLAAGELGEDRRA